MFGNGSDEVLNFAFSAFCDDRCPAIFPDISYGFYPVFAEQCGVLYRTVPLREDYSIDPRDYFSAGGTVFIANPNAPTGHVQYTAQTIPLNPPYEKGDFTGKPGISIKITKLQKTMGNYSLEGKVALVTGASYGIGFALATAFASAGAKIAFNDIKQELVDKGLAAYKAEGIEAKGYVCDVTSEEQVNAMVAQIEKEVGIVDILVNNAGIIKRIPMIEMTAAEFRQVIDVDLNAPFIVSKAVIPSMIKKGHGKIINICSMMSELGRETVSAYAAAKGGLKMLTRNICSEFGGANIQCNAIGPGYIATQQTAPLRERQPDGSRHPFDQFIISKTPAGRWGTTDDLIGPAVFLASDASDFVNGHVLYVDGGILAYIGKQP